jgi:hypothetical protein
MVSRRRWPSPPGAALLPIDSRFDDAQIFVQDFHGGTGIDTARRPLLELLSQSLAMRAKVLKRNPFFQTQIPFRDQFNWT